MCLAPAAVTVGLVVFRSAGLTFINFRLSPHVPRGDVEMLMTCEFINRSENVLLAGPSGIGKSHIAQALANEAVKHGYRILFKQTHKLLGHLNARRADGGFAQYMKKLQGLDLLILDDFGLVQLTPQNANDLYGDNSGQI